MATLNKVMIIGRVIDNPEEPRTLQGGTRVIKIRFAVGRSKKNAQGQWEPDKNQLFVDCKAFSYADAKRDLVGIIQQYVKKGDSLYLEGRLSLDTWEDKNGGGKRSKHEIVIENLEFLGGGKSGDDDQGQQRQQAPPPRRPAPPAAPQGDGGYDGGDDGSIPF